MSSAENYNNSWSDADVQRYLKGELSAREMHQLEKAALDDPFLSDALEGLATTPQPDADLSQLRNRLAARVEEKQEHIVAPWFRRPGVRVAAAIILLLGVGSTAWYTLLNKKEKELPEAPALVKIESAPAATTPPTEATPPSRSSPAMADSTSIAANTDARRAENKPTFLRRAKRMEAKKAQTDQAQAQTEQAQADLATTDKAKEARIKTDTANYAYAPAAAAPTGKTETVRAEALSFSGRVVDANNRPLAGASLILKKNNNIGTTTNALGEFNLKLKAQDTVGQMTVALIGYQPANVTLNTDDQTKNIIRLQEAKAYLDEVVVTGYGTQRKETRVIAPSESEDKLDSLWLKVYPVPGRQAYQQYLVAAKKTLTLDTTLRGTESISFLVDQKGQITDFKIEQSISPAHDAGLIQVITAGPAWKLLRGKKARAVVSMIFP